MATPFPRSKWGISLLASSKPGDSKPWSLTTPLTGSELGDSKPSSSNTMWFVSRGCSVRGEARGKPWTPSGPIKKFNIVLYCGRLARVENSESALLFKVDNCQTLSLAESAEVGSLISTCEVAFLKGIPRDETSKTTSGSKILRARQSRRS